MTALGSSSARIGGAGSLDGILGTSSVLMTDAVGSSATGVTGVAGIGVGVSSGSGLSVVGIGLTIGISAGVEMLGS